MGDQMRETTNTLAEADKLVRRLKRMHPQTEITKKKIDMAEKMVEQLQGSRLLLEDNYRCKTVALKIEESCRLLSAGKVDARAAVNAKKEEPQQDAARRTV